MTRRAALGLWVLLLGCGGTVAAEPPRALLLISIDGFRFDYPELHASPNLAGFAWNGVRARALIPAFPTKTFPNHYTIVTGLWPDRHGVIGNTMVDPGFDETFRISDRRQVEDGRWWGGEPLWVTAERQGLVAATMFWPGSEAEIGGVRPTHWFSYYSALPDGERVETVLAWLDLPPEERPSFLTLYFSLVDSAGHRHGPDSPEVAAAVLAVDAHLGALFEGLERRGLADTVDVVIVSDHGMSAYSHERLVVLDEVIEMGRLADDGVRVVTLSPVLGIRAPADRAEDLVRSLSAHPHLSAWRKQDVPERLHYGRHPRVPDVVALADPGWRIVLADDLDSLRSRPAGGGHGSDPADPRMHAFFAARGPSFRRGAVVESFESVHLYELLAGILGLAPAPNDGDPEALLHLLEGSTAAVGSPGPRSRR